MLNPHVTQLIAEGRISDQHRIAAARRQAAEARLPRPRARVRLGVVLVRIGTRLREPGEAAPVTPLVPKPRTPMRELARTQDSCAS